MNGCCRDGCLEGQLPGSVQRLLSEHGWRATRVRVPSTAPGSKEQWKEWSDAYWPLTWRIPVGTSALPREETLAPAPGHTVHPDA